MGPEGMLTLSWLVRLRWAAAGVYTGLLGWAAGGLGLDLPLLLPGSLLLVLVASNLGLMAWGEAEGPAPRALAGGVLILDTLLLGGLLYATGGPANPCSALFVVQVALAASALGTRWGWGMALLVSGVYAALFPWHLPLGHLDHAMGGLGWHLWGMWGGLAVTSLLIAHFVGRLSDTLARERARHEALRRRADREARLAALTALAAGAAHELASPLGTIAVAAEDLDPSDPAGLAEDLRLIRREVGRCRRILDDLALEGGQLAAEASRPLALRSWVQGLDLGPGVVLDLPEATLVAPPKALDLVLRGLVKNAREAGAPGDPVRVEGEVGPDGAVHVWVRDRGPGFPPGLADQIGEPFLSTKGEEGLGLGLFLAQGFMARLGGRLVVDSRPGETRVGLGFPPPGGR